LQKAFQFFSTFLKGFAKLRAKSNQKLLDLNLLSTFGKGGTKTKNQRFNKIFFIF
jgi:hypothetical protein